MLIVKPYGKSIVTGSKISGLMVHQLETTPK